MKKYSGIEWLKVIACIGIVSMHMMANNTYKISGVFYNTVLDSFTDFVYVFMALSAFGLCCGYYQKVMDGRISWENFYKKRYLKILPFFTLMIAIDLIHDFSTFAMAEGFAEMTLLHKFLPADMHVVGVGWFLGIVFIFYLLFPFFTVLIKTKRRAWLSLFVAVGLNMVCDRYFGLTRRYFLYSACYFVLGGLIYKYSEAIEDVRWYYLLSVLVLTTGCYYFFGENVFTRIAVTASLLMFSISVKAPLTTPIRLISGISMEIYLSHMFIFRVVEKMRLNTRFGTGVLQYCITLLLVFSGACMFSYTAQKILNRLLQKKAFRQTSNKSPAGIDPSVTQ